MNEHLKKVKVKSLIGRQTGRQTHIDRDSEMDREIDRIKNKYVRTKMRPKEGTKIELQRDLSDLSDFVRFVRVSGLDLSDLPISAI